MFWEHARLNLLASTRRRKTSSFARTVSPTSKHLPSDKSISQPYLHGSIQKTLKTQERSRHTYNAYSPGWSSTSSMARLSRTQTLASALVVKHQTGGNVQPEPHKNIRRLSPCSKPFILIKAKANLGSIAAPPQRALLLQASSAIGCHGRHCFESALARPHACLRRQMSPHSRQLYEGPRRKAGLSAEGLAKRV